MTPTDRELLVESLKLEFEWQKHLTTLISGIVVALVTVLQAFFAVGENGRPYSSQEAWLLAICFLLLVSGLLASIISMNLAISFVRKV